MNLSGPQGVSAEMPNSPARRFACQTGGSMELVESDLLGAYNSSALQDNTKPLKVTVAALPNPSGTTESQPAVVDIVRDKRSAD
jgi:hypothetical protein